MEQNAPTSPPKAKRRFARASTDNAVPAVKAAPTTPKAKGKVDTGKSAALSARVGRPITMSALVTRAAGATIAQMYEATGWQQHSVRGFLAGTVKKEARHDAGLGQDRCWPDLPSDHRRGGAGMIADDLEAIAGENLKQLRERWVKRWGICPRLRSVALLRHTIAWRVQVEASGGLDAATRRMLLGRAAGAETQLIEGTVLTREWLGTAYRVEVAGDTFIHDGRRWGSLAEVARSITGSRWNGPRFFGLRKAA